MPQARKFLGNRRHVSTNFDWKNRRHMSTNSKPAAGAKNLRTFDRKNRRHVSTNSTPAAGAKFLRTFDRENRRRVSTNSKPAAGAKILRTFYWKNRRQASTNSKPAAGAKFLRIVSTKIVDSQEFVDGQFVHVSEIVDTYLFVERVTGGLDNRRHVSTIHEMHKKHNTKFVDSQKFVDWHFQKPKSGVLKNRRLCLRGGVINR